MDFSASLVLVSHLGGSEICTGGDSGELGVQVARPSVYAALQVSTEGGSAFLDRSSFLSSQTRRQLIPRIQQFPYQ